MSLLERVVYLLTTARAAAAVDPLLSILIRCGPTAWQPALPSASAVACELPVQLHGLHMWTIPSASRSCRT